MGQQIANLIRRAFDRVRQQSRVLVDDLHWNTADRRGHYRFFLPQCLGNREPESLAKTLLNHDRRGALQSVHLQWSPGGQFNNMNVGLPVSFLPEDRKSTR